MDNFVADEIRAMARELAELANAAPQERILRLMRLRDTLNKEIAKAALILGGNR